MRRKKDEQRNKKENMIKLSEMKEITSEEREHERTAGEKNRQKKNFEIKQVEEHAELGGDMQEEMPIQKDNQPKITCDEISGEESGTPDSVPSSTNASYKHTKGEEVNRWITYYGVNSMSKDISSTCNLNTQHARKS